MAILKVRDAKGNEYEILAIRGEKGYTPQKGVDYWTQTDKDEIIAEVLSTFVDVSEVAL